MCMLEGQENKCEVKKSKNISLYAGTCYKNPVSGEKKRMLREKADKFFTDNIY